MDEKAIALAALAALVILNAISFALMGCDKRRAREGRWRVCERALFLAAACFGGLGGVLGMKVFHHKTKHWYFGAFFPLLLVLQIALLILGAYLLFR